MGNSFTVSASSMRGINRSIILEMIRRESPISRAAIAEKLEVSLPTVVRIVDDLLTEGLVRLAESKEWSGGRRRSLLEFNAEEHVVIGVDLGGTKIYGAVANLGGEIIEETEIQRHGSTGDESYERLTGVIDTLLKSPNVSNRKLHGIGVGAPGVTYHQSGVVALAPSLNWRDYPLKAKLSERFNLPVIVDNDLNLAALGEHWFGAGLNTQNMVLLSIGTGIGAGIILNGTLFRGSHEAAGEVGYFIPSRALLGQRFDGFGALEFQASGMGIAEKARLALKGKATPDELAALTAERVFEAADQGEAWASELINEALDYIAIAVANISAFLDPDVIILGGGMVRHRDLATPVLQRIENAIPVRPRIVHSQLGYRATVLGSVVTVLHNTDNFYSLRKLT